MQPWIWHKPDKVWNELWNKNQRFYHWMSRKKDYAWESSFNSLEFEAWNWSAFHVNFCRENVFKNKSTVWTLPNYFLSQKCTRFSGYSKNVMIKDKSILQINFSRNGTKVEKNFTDFFLLYSKRSITIPL